MVKSSRSRPLRESQEAQAHGLKSLIKPLSFHHRWNKNGKSATFTAEKKQIMLEKVVEEKGFEGLFDFNVDKGFEGLFYWNVDEILSDFNDGENEELATGGLDLEAFQIPTTNNKTHANYLPSKGKGGLGSATCSSTSSDIDTAAAVVEEKGFEGLFDFNVGKGFEGLFYLNVDEFLSDFNEDENEELATGDLDLDLDLEAFVPTTNNVDNILCYEDESLVGIGNGIEFETSFGVHVSMMEGDDFTNNKIHANSLLSNGKGGSRSGSASCSSTSSDIDTAAVAVTGAVAESDYQEYGIGDENGDMINIDDLFLSLIHHS